jgi:hypothetical protein
VSIAPTVTPRQNKNPIQKRRVINRAVKIKNRDETKSIQVMRQPRHAVAKVRVAVA